MFIPFVNRVDLLRKAVASIPARLTTEPVVINNSGRELPFDTLWERVSVETPPVPLSFTQSQNYMLQMARMHPFYFWMHSDAEDNLGILDKLRDMAMQQREKWGAIFTLYDTLCVYNTKAVSAIGGYDTNFPAYFSDNDFYRRLSLAGFPTLESHLPVKHVGSQTINSDPFLQYINGITFPFYGDLYRRKWGGEPGHEIYARPWGGRFDGET
ncbi:MAG: glycosyltransferase family 2 protein [Sulfobacillus sp.]